MNFREASEVAKRHPGAVISREGSGSFVVRLNKEPILATAPPVDDSLSKRLGECEEQLAQLKRQHDAVIERKQRLRRRIKRLKKKFDRVLCAKNSLVHETARLTEMVGRLSRDKIELQARVSKVCDSEWARIKEVDGLALRADSAARHDARISVKCSCRGEVPNCARCSGNGVYTTDGFGNRI
jgi:hypothetical protein